MDIGKKLKELRLQNDLTLGDLASRSELTKGFLSQVERNLTTPSIATLEDILEALGSSLSEFFREEEEKQMTQERLGLLRRMRAEQRVAYAMRIKKQMDAKKKHDNGEEEEKTETESEAN